jgi:hypothetical protein
MQATHELGSIAGVARLGDQVLIATVERLLRQERTVSAQLLIHLGEIEGRQLYLQRAFSSMFEYCVKALHLSEAEAYLRIGAARLGRRFPRVLQMFAAGELHLSALKLLAPVLDEVNCEQLLAAARFKSKRDVELLVAHHRAQPDVPDAIRKLPQPSLAPKPADDAQTLLLSRPASSATTVSTPDATGEVLQEQSPVANNERQPASASQPAPTSKTGATVSPLGPSRYKVQLTASQQLHDKLRHAQELLRHELPSGDLSQVLERALDLLIAERMKRRFGQGAKPRAKRKPASPKPGGRHIPHDVRREALQRDGALCSFVSEDGKRCEQRGMLELHHEEPFARGGPATTANIRVLCKAHNRWLAERDYGRAFIEQRIVRARRERSNRQQVPEQEARNELELERMPTD